MSELIIAGWTGRDHAILQHHIDELAKLGVKPPPSTPCFYRASNTLLTTAGDIQVLGPESSGEVEFVLIATPQGMLVGLGSDHTDRKAEAYDITVSKQMCPKPLGPECWRFEEVAGHWDRLVLRSHSTRRGTRRLYQEGPVTAMLPPADIVRRYGAPGDTLPAGCLMYGGTLPARGGIECGEHFEMELIDPVRNRSLTHAYSVAALPHA